MLELDREINFDSARAEEFFESLPSRAAVVRIEPREALAGARPLLLRTADLRRRMRFRKLAQSRKSGTQKILHRSFPIELINITAIPFIARPVEVRHVNQENCFPRQERADWSARNSLEKIPVVPASEGGGERDE